MKNFKKVALVATVTAMLGGFATTANAVNWLMLQGTEKMVRHHVLKYGAFYSQLTRKILVKVLLQNLHV